MIPEVPLMPIELSMWRIDSGLSPVEQTRMDLEDRLEDLLAKNISIASRDWFVIARQVATPWDNKIDLLCLDSWGTLVVLELKRNKTERVIVAQALDYGSYVRNIPQEEILRIYANYQDRYCQGQAVKSLEEAFCARFGVKKLPDELNSTHELVIVAATLDAATERIVTYLAEEYDVRINALFFQVFKDGEREYLTRAWFREPSASEDGAPAQKTGRSAKVEWNNEYYVNFGPTEHRDWDDAVRYGFVSAGVGSKYRDAMLRLEPKDRIWVNVPGAGYVGVGIVEAAAVPVDQFLVTDDKGQQVPITKAPHKATNIDEYVGDPDNVEYLPKVRWLKTVPLSQAVWERGFFSNQNVVAEPRDPKWPYTVDRLKQHFGIQ
jgi:hypothetical protein